MEDNGLIKRAHRAAEKTTIAQVKEELELTIVDLQMQEDKIEKGLTKEEIAKELEKLEGIDVQEVGDTITGEYKDINFTITEDNSVEVEDSKIVGEKPEGVAQVITPAEGLEEVEIQVMAGLKDGKVVSIEAINGAELKEEKSSTEKIFKVKDNGKYIFKITGDNGRSIKVSCTVKNAIPTKVDILTAIEEMEQSGVQKIKVKGKTSETAEEKTEIYSFNVIRQEGDMVLDGTTSYEGSTLVNKVYEFGDANKDVATAGEYAANTVVLKVEGNLTINEGVTLTAVKSAAGYGGPKGMIVYCTGTLTNNGSISMTARGAKAVGQNVYLFKNIDGSYEYIPKDGGVGGRGLNGTGKSGALPRATGGGGGTTWGRDERLSGQGGAGTSFSGGAGARCSK